MRRFGKLAALGLLVVLLSGCGQVVPETETIEEPTLVIFADGRLTAYLVGEFDKSYYDFDELAAMAQEEASEFSGSGDTAPVKMESVETSAVDGGTRVVVAYTFDSAASYEGFTEDTLFFGTVEEALSQGYGSDVTLLNVKDGSILTGGQLSQNQEKHLVVFCPKPAEPSQEQDGEKQLVICCPWRVGFLSEGAALDQDGGVRISWTEGSKYAPVYILLGR